MDDDPGITKCMSTPERKREYIERWLQGRSLINQDNATQSNEQEFISTHTVGNVYFIIYIFVKLVVIM